MAGEHVTIHNLEVRFDVPAGSDEEVFARLFERHIKAWQRLYGEAERYRGMSECDRMIEDLDQGGPP
jgi:hypothetical protein